MAQTHPERPTPPASVAVPENPTSHNEQMYNKKKETNIYDGTEMVQVTLFTRTLVSSPNPHAIAAISKGTRAIKLCSNNNPSVLNSGAG